MTLRRKGLQGYRSRLVLGKKGIRKGFDVADYQFSEHAYDMLKERNIKESWVKGALEKPSKKEAKENGTIHYIKSIEEYGGRYLRVIVNPDAHPQKIVTLFFNRRLRRQT